LLSYSFFITLIIEPILTPLAILTDGIQFTGSISNLSAYRMRGSDKIILRRKGGASRKQIQKDPAFESTRNLNYEWAAVTWAAMNIRAGLAALKPLADYNISGPLNALVKKIQSSDTLNPKGRRSILFSRQPESLNCFHFNRQTIFDSVVRQPLDVQIDRATATIDVTLPLLQPQINFFPNPRYAYFRILMACTSLSDFVCKEGSTDYQAPPSNMPGYEHAASPWAPTQMSQEPASFRMVPMKDFPLMQDMILIFGAGIQYGMPGADGSIQPVPHAGAARIIKCV
jgi:hypothetical protein